MHYSIAKKWTIQKKAYSEHCKVPFVKLQGRYKKLAKYVVQYLQIWNQTRLINNKIKVYFIIKNKFYWHNVSSNTDDDCMVTFFVYALHGKGKGVFE